MYVHASHNVFLSSLCKWKRPKWLLFVVKRYAVREAKKCRYAVRKAKIGRYAVRNGGGGVTLHYVSFTCDQRTFAGVIHLPASLFWQLSMSTWSLFSSNLRFVVTVVNLIGRFGLKREKKHVSAI